MLAAIDCPGWEENLVKGIASGVIFEERKLRGSAATGRIVAQR